jgi:hypothetical protein
VIAQVTAALVLTLVFGWYIYTGLLASRHHHLGVHGWRRGAEIAILLPLVAAALTFIVIVNAMIFGYFR